MPPNQGERITTLEARTQAIQADLAAYHAAAEEKFMKLKESNKAEHAATRNKLDANQASLTVLIVLLTPKSQGILLPPPSLILTATMLQVPVDPALVQLPPLPLLAGRLQQSLGNAMPTATPAMVLPQPGGLLFSNIVAPRNENSREAESTYHA
jgi:hypothetical protein